MGCCIGHDDSFGGGKESNVGGGSGEEPFCDPFLVPDDIPFGGETWPPWVARAGCGIISMLMHDEIKFGDEVKANNPNPDKKKVYTPENVKKITDCINKCVKKTLPSGHHTDIRNTGLLPSNHLVKCWMKCKTELMESLGVNIDPSVFTVGSDHNAKAMAMPSIGDLCPPLCKGTEVVALMILIRRKWSCNWYGPKRDLCIPKQELQRSGHAVRGKVVCCTKGKEVCFDFEDYAPQRKGGGRFCIGTDGKGTDRKIPYGVYGETPGVLPPGRCMKNQNLWRGRGKPPCYEMAPEESYIFGLYIEDAPVLCTRSTPCK